MRKDTQEAIRRFNVKIFGNQKNIEIMEDKLHDDERVVYITPTNAIILESNTRKKEKLPGIFLVSNKRVLFYYKAAMVERLETFDLAEIKSIDCSGNGITGGHINIHTMIKTLDLMVAYKKEVMQEIQSSIENAIYEYKNRGNVNQAQVDEVEQIEKLHNLFDKGIISQDEFEMKKKQLLGL